MLRQVRFCTISGDARHKVKPFAIQATFQMHSGRFGYTGGMPPRRHVGTRHHLGTGGTSEPVHVLDLNT